MIETIKNILWVIVLPLVIAFLGKILFKIKTWIILSIELMIILLLTVIGMIENYPTGSLQNQFMSYFRNLQNSFYLMYLPIIVMTIVFARIIKSKGFGNNF